MADEKFTKEEKETIKKGLEKVRRENDSDIKYTNTNPKEKEELITEIDRVEKIKRKLK